MASSEFPSLQKLFNDIAAKSGWPTDVIDKVTVSMNPDGVNLEYDEALDEQIFDLEYGKFEQPPRAAMRMLKSRSTPAIVEAGLKDMTPAIVKLL
jgi:hypothetical protein